MLIIEQVPPRHRFSDTIDFLIDGRFELAQLRAADLQQQVSLAIDFEIVGTRDLERDHPRIGFGRDHKVVFHLPLVAVKDKVHT